MNADLKKAKVYRVNAGRIPREHWTQDASEGGGRIIGEVCHFVDFMQFLTGTLADSVYAECIGGGATDVVSEDSVFITLQFGDGSRGLIAYLSEGDTSLPKERIEIFGEGKAFVIEDFRSAALYVDGHEKKETLRQQDKGQAEETRIVCAVVAEGGPRSNYSSGPRVHYARDVSHPRLFTNRTEKGSEK
jgi:predicted dehydrogenase